MRAIIYRAKALRNLFYKASMQGMVKLGMFEQHSQNI